MITFNINNSGTKNLVIIFVILISFVFSGYKDGYRQQAFLLFDSGDVVIYADKYDNKISRIIRSTRATCYNVSIMNKCENRYHVSVCDNFSSGDSIIASGWVDKYSVGLFGWSWTADGQPYVELFDYPVKNSHSIIVPSNGKSMILLDYTDNGDFVKVEYVNNDSIYIGWINKYCPDCNAACN